MKRNVRLALIGASRIAGRILPQIREAAGLEVSGIAASDRARAEAFSARHGIGKVFASYEEAFASPEIDAVYISVLSADHFALIVKALGSGKHVLCEKPMVLTQDQAREATELAARQRKILLEGFMYRYHPQIEMLKRASTDGSIGAVKSIHLSFSFDLGTIGTSRGTRQAGGGALNDLGSYLVDFSTLILGAQKPSRVRASGTLTDPHGIDREFSATLEYPNGVTAVLDAAIDRPSANLWEIRGERGAFGLLRFDPQGVSSMGDKNVAIRIDEDSNARIESVPSDRPAMDQFRLEFENFVEAIQGRAPPFISSEEMLLKSSLLDQIRAQLYAGESV